MRRLVILLTVIFTISVSTYCSNNILISTTPESVGIASSTLLNMYKDIQKCRYNIHSVLLIKDGKIVTEGYFYPYEKDTLHDIYSSTKSIMSGLVGIAIQNKYIDSVNAPIYKYFPEYLSKDSDPRMKEITIRHLLTNTSGLVLVNDDFMNNPDSKDFIKQILKSPLTSNPGETYTYNPGNFNVLSAIITKATGMTTLEFAKLYLFDKIGVKNFRWTKDLQGVYLGSCNLLMTTSDMSKIGYLYLNKGKWNNENIIPEDWIQESLKVYNIVPGPAGHGYSYGWNIWKAPVQEEWQKDWFSSYGFGGQMILVIPNKNAVLVVTASEFSDMVKIFSEYLSSIFNTKSEAVPNESVLKELNDLVTKIGKGTPKEVKKSALINTYFNKKYIMESNSLDIKSISFSDYPDNGKIVFEFNDNRIYMLNIGLDNLYRSSTEFPYYQDYYPIECSIYSKGIWKNDNTFNFDFTPIGQAASVAQCRVVFEGNGGLKITITGFNGNNGYLKIWTSEKTTIAGKAEN